jgi:hypothetical protein
MWPLPLQAEGSLTAIAISCSEPTDFSAAHSNIAHVCRLALLGQNRVGPLLRCSRLFAEQVLPPTSRSENFSPRSCVTS